MHMFHVVFHLFSMLQGPDIYHRILVLIFIWVLAEFVKESNASCRRFEKLSVIIKRPGPPFLLPETAFMAYLGGWVYVARDDKYNLDIYRYQHYDIFYTLFYQNDLVGVAPVYDSRDKTTVAGHRENVRKQGLALAMAQWFGSKLPTYWRKMVERGRGWSAMFHRKVMYIDNLQETRVRYGMILFVHPEVVKQRKPAPCTQNVVYFKGSHTRWHQVPHTVSDIPTQLPHLIKHGCFDKRGNYYFFNLYSRTGWRNFHGFFALYDNEGRLSGFGVMLIGVMNEFWERMHHPDRGIHSTFQIYTDVLVPYRHEIILNDNLSFNNKCTTESLTALYVMTTLNTRDFKCTKK